jgi:hypothetical protein
LFHLIDFILELIEFLLVGLLFLHKRSAADTQALKEDWIVLSLGSFIQKLVEARFEIGLSNL